MVLDEYSKKKRILRNIRSVQEYCQIQNAQLRGRGGGEGWNENLLLSPSFGRNSTLSLKYSLGLWGRRHLTGMRCRFMYYDATVATSTINRKMTWHKTENKKNRTTDVLSTWTWSLTFIIKCIQIHQWIQMCPYVALLHKGCPKKKVT